MTTLHHPIDPKQIPTSPPSLSLSRPAQCLRHHKWMAACTDCREARATDQPRAVAHR